MSVLHRPRQPLPVPWLALALLAPAAALAWAGLLRAQGLALPGPVGWDRLLLLLVLAPVLEETVFRAGLQEGLVRRGWCQRWAIGLSSLVFAACHALVQGWPALAVLLPSLVLGQVYGSSGLRAAMACHAWFNLCFLTAVGLG